MKAPLVIKVSCALLALKTLVIVATADAFSRAAVGAIAAIGVVFALAIVGIVGFWLMRRWGPLLILGLMAFSTWAGPAFHIDLRMQWPLLGPAAGLVVGVIVLLPAVIYWRQMSWKVLGPLGGSVEKGSAHAHR